MKANILKKTFTSIMAAATLVASASAMPSNAAITKTFKIQYSVSGTFTTTKENYSYTSYAEIQDYTGASYSNSNHHYEVIISRLLSTPLDKKFTTHSTKYGSVKLKKNKKYNIMFINNDAISWANYVVGTFTLS